MSLRDQRKFNRVTGKLDSHTLRSVCPYDHTELIFVENGVWGVDECRVDEYDEFVIEDARQLRDFRTRQHRLNAIFVEVRRAYPSLRTPKGFEYERTDANAELWDEFERDYGSVIELVDAGELTKIYYSPAEWRVQYVKSFPDKSAPAPRHNRTLRRGRFAAKGRQRMLAHAMS